MTFLEHIDTTSALTMRRITGDSHIVTTCRYFDNFVLVRADISPYIVVELIFNRTTVVHRKLETFITYFSCILYRESADTGRTGVGDRK